MSPPSQRIVAFILLLLLPGLAAAWDSIFFAAPSLPSDFLPSRVTAVDAEGLWASGTANGYPVLVRYDNSGSIELVRYPYPATAATVATNDQTYALVSYPAGGLLGIDFLDGICSLRRRDAYGRLLWSAHGGSNWSGGTPDPCVHELRVEGGGNVWLFGGDRFAPDGTHLPPTPSNPDDLISEDRVADPTSNATYLVGSVGLFDLTLPPFHAKATVEKIGNDGKVIWRAQVPTSDYETALYRAFIGSDGNLYAYGLQGASDGSNLKLYGISLTPAGTIRWSHDFPNPGSSLFDKVDSVAMPDGSTAVLYYHQPPPAGSSTDSSPTLARISATGEMLWQRASGFPSALPSHYCIDSVLRAAGNNDIVAATQCRNGDEGQSDWPIYQSRFDVNGTILYSGSMLSAGSTSRFDLSVLADASSLTAINGTLQRLDRNGNALQSPQTTATIPAVSANVAETVAGDGSVFLLTSNGSSKSYAVSAYGRDGNRLWNTALPAMTADGAMVSARLIARSTDVCAVGILDSAKIAQCYARDTGKALPQIQLSSLTANNNGAPFAFRLPNDQLLVLYAAVDGSAHHALIDIQGHIVHDIPLLNSDESWGYTVVNAKGTALIRTGSGVLTKFRADGTRVFSVTNALAGSSVGYQMFLSDDDNILLLGNVPVLSAQLLGTNGNLLWKATPALPFDSSSSFIRATSVRFSANDVYIYVYRSTAAGLESDPGYLMKLTLATGDTTWSKAAPYPRSLTPLRTDAPPRLLLDNTGQRVLLLTNYAKKIQLRKFSMLDGSDVALDYENSGVDSFTMYEAALTADGALKIVSDTTDTVTGSAWQINTLTHPFDVPPSIRIDQPGIAGTWYAPYSTGQGFTLDYIAGNNTVFMPWFTFSLTQVNDPSSVKWFTLQGQPGIGNTSVDLGMYVGDAPGAFNSGKTGARKVGTAQLGFDDCSRGTLRYQFDASTNEGVGGTISLTRLTPQISPCLLADGSTQSVSVNASTQGFDARQSGSWYDPNTSGQGIELTVIPAGNGSNGLLFGAWFTYDPAGAGNDPLNQHWFTLQGDLAAAYNGKVTLPILQIFGGTLDGMPTRNSSQVGTATLTFSGCAQAQLDYQFDNSAVAHAYARLTGSLHLTKIGGCAAP